MARAPHPAGSLPMDLEDGLDAALASADAAVGLGPDLLRQEEELAGMISQLDDILPRFEDPPGWHLCWLSLSNERDTPLMRERWGYVPVKLDELPQASAYLGRDAVGTDSRGESLIRVREMVLYKIPVHRAEAIMKHFHHDMPNQLVAGLDPRQNPQLHEARDRKGTPLIQPVEVDANDTYTPRRYRQYFTPAVQQRS